MATDAVARAFRRKVDYYLKQIERYGAPFLKEEVIWEVVAEQLEELKRGPNKPAPEIPKTLAIDEEDDEEFDFS